MMDKPNPDYFTDTLHVIEYPKQICDVKCRVTHCVHNLFNERVRYLACNLKYIEIGVRGKCLKFESIGIGEDKND